MLVSGVQQSESAAHVHVSALFYHKFARTTFAKREITAQTQLDELKLIKYEDRKNVMFCFFPSLVLIFHSVLMDKMSSYFGILVMQTLNVKQKFGFFV